MCQCEVYEMCPECAPSVEEYERVAAARDAVLTEAGEVSPREV